MTSRITHNKLLPKNIAYWDYYILCRLNMTAALALQRMEYWDGTKADGNIHSEQINEHLEAAGKPATQDTSRFVYKSHEELSWELIGCCCERTLPKVVDMLLSQLRYLTWRKNPYNTLDHTRQYCFQAKLVQSHLDRLSGLVKHFLDLGRMSVPVLYAIEQLTAEGYYIAQMAEKDGQIVERTDVELLSTERITSKLATMHKQMHEDEQEAQSVKAAGKKFTYRLPRFVRTELKKDELHGFSAEVADRDGKIAVSTPQNCRLDTAKLPEGESKTAATIPVITSVTTSNDYTQESDTGSADLTPEKALTATISHPLDFSSLLAAVSALSHEQKQQLTQALLGSSSPMQDEEPEHLHHPEEIAPLVLTEAQQTAVQEPPEQLHDAPQGNSTQKGPTALDTASSGSPPSQSACPSETRQTSCKRSRQRKQSSAQLPATGQNTQEEASVTLPVVEPEMTGAWDAEKVVQYAEYKIGTRYRAKARQKQLEAAALMHAALPDMTLLQFRHAYDDRNDSWWQQHNGKLDVTDMSAPDKSGEMRIVTALHRIQARQQIKPMDMRNQACTASPQKASSVQQLLEAAAPGFQFLSQVELMKLPLEERRAYNARLRAHMAAHKEQEQRELTAV